MIPQGRLSTTIVPGTFLTADAIEPPNMLIDFETGGVALNDPSQGLEVYTWASWWDKDDQNVYVQAPGALPVLVFNAPGLTELSFSFDQNMRPYHAYVQEGVAKLRWYDTVLGANDILILGPDVSTPRVALDDKRAFQVEQGLNDVILAYIRIGNLYYRQQRDRFENEYLLKTDVGAKLIRIGMTNKLRLQFLLEVI